MSIVRDKKKHGSRNGKVDETIVKLYVVCVMQMRTKKLWTISSFLFSFLSVCILVSCTVCVYWQDAVCKWISANEEWI